MTCCDNPAVDPTDVIGVDLEEKRKEKEKKTSSVALEGRIANW